MVGIFMEDSAVLEKTLEWLKDMPLDDPYEVVAEVASAQDHTIEFLSSKTT